MNSEIHSTISVFQDLNIYASDDFIYHLVELVSRQKKNGWTRNIEREKSISVQTEMYCLACTKKGKREAANLWIAKHAEGKWYISNIVPTELRELSYGQYNFILQQFHDTFISGEAKLSGIEIDLSPPEKCLTDYIDEHAARLLNAFLGLANQSTGTGHPCDEERWYQFVFYVHSKNYFDEFHTSILYRFMEEVYKWPGDRANKIVIEYETAIRMLRAYDKQLGISSLTT